MITAARQRFDASNICLSKAKKNWSQAELPKDEAGRLEALFECKILDTPPEKEFNEIAQLAALVCGTPIALVSLIDANRQWLKSKVGIQARSIPRSTALCAHTILQKDVLVVPNTLTDSRFATNPLVTSEPHIRFYAGIPLITSDRKALGTLCVIDRVPRELNTQQVEALRTLAGGVVKLLELRRQVAKVEEKTLKPQQRWNTSRQFFTKIATGLGLASAILVGVGLVSYRSITSLAQNNDWQIQHYQVLKDLKDIRFQIQSATIAEHYYITTGEASYLEPYANVATEIQAKIEAIKQDASNSDQRERLAILEPLISKRFASIGQITRFKKTKGVEFTSQVVLHLKLKKLTGDIEAVIQAIEKTENARLQQRLQEEVTRTCKAIMTFSTGICLNFLILAGVYYLTYREIGERKHTEAALEQERDFTDAILDTVGTLVVVLDPQGKIIGFNRTCEENTGYCFAEVKGKYFWELFGIPNEADIARNHWEKLLASELSNQYENYWLTRDGKRRRIAWTNTTLRNQTGAVEYAIASGIDITEHSTIEEALRSSEQHLRNVISSLFTFVAVLTPDGILIQANQALLDVAKLQADDVLGKPLAEIYWWSYSSTVQAQLQTALGRVSQGERVRYEVEGRVSENQFITIDLALTPMFDSVGKVTYLIASGIDVTERKQAEAARQQANKQLSNWVSELKQRNREITLLGEMSDFLQACLTVEEACSTLAQLIQPLFPQASGGIFLIRASKNLVEPVATWGSPILTDIKTFTHTDCWALRRGKPHWVDDTDNGLLCKHVQHALPAESICVPMVAQGEALGVLYLSSLEKNCLTPAKQKLATTVAEHIALALANLKLREKLHNQSVRDGLTGLFNRRYMEESLEREMRRCDRKQLPLSVIMLDVDYFKHFNDSFGHKAGDAVLRELAHYLQRYVRGSDIACRYGGEEFILILPEASLSVAQQRAEQIREGARHLNVECGDQPVGEITLSLGVASYPLHGLQSEAVIKAADVALYRAKEQGRDRVIVA